MIIRKPFKFLIRHFKIINVLILALMIYATIKVGYLSNFFNTYVSNGYMTSDSNIVSTYIGALLPIALMIIILISGIIYYLFKTKDKPNKFYLILLIFYIILFILSMITRGVLNNYELMKIEASQALMYRDLSKFAFYPQFLLMIFVFLNAIGFDIQRFEFTNLQDELDIADEDNAEVELNVGIEDYKVKRNVRRTLRELKYYIIENKFVFKIISCILLSIVSVVIIIWFINLNKSVKVAQSFTHSNFNLSVKDSILTTLDYNGNLINTDKYYLAVKINVQNKSNIPRSLDSDNFWLDMGSYYIYPTLNKSLYFTDLGEPYYGDKIAPQDTHNYIICYELNNNEIKSKYEIKIIDTITYKDGVATPTYKKIELSPNLYTSIYDNGTYNLEDFITLNNTKLGNTTIKVNSATTTTNYKFNYNSCINDDCKIKTDSITTNNNLKKSLLVIDNNLDIDQESPYLKYKKLNNFYSDFVKIRYTYGEKEYISNVVDRTSSKCLPNINVLEVDYNVLLASSISLEITIRNQQTIINLK